MADCERVTNINGAVDQSGQDQVRDYSAEKQRVSDYIQHITSGMIGSGDDPIGFLLARHAALVAE